MARTLEVNIKETDRELKALLHQQKKGRIKERVQVLYLLVTKQAETASTAAMLIGRNYSTVKRWLRTYRQTGINDLLELKSGRGRKLSLSSENLEALENRLKQPEGFDSYGAIQAWLKENYGVEICYSTLHHIVHTRLKASLKVVRPQSAKRDESKAIDFEKKSLTIKSDGGSLSLQEPTCTLLVYR